MDQILSSTAPPRKTKIAATIGPSSSSREVLEQLVKGGMSLARFKFSHATPTTHSETIRTLREVREVVQADSSCSVKCVTQDTTPAWCRERTGCRCANSSGGMWP